LGAGLLFPVVVGWLVLVLPPVATGGVLLLPLLGGSLIFCPTLISLGFSIPFNACNSETVVPFAFAMLLRVSPLFTSWILRV